MDMNFADCEQLKIDNDWSLARVNACHIAVQNDETGLIWKEMNSMNLKIDRITIYQEIQICAWGLIVSCIVVLVINKIWGKK
jgi:hypothetical protein